jgi:DNA-binding MarR family transcriptional regulator
LLRALDAELVADQGLSLTEYDALAQLAAAPDRRLRMSELADRMVISRSGVTRLVDRMASTGLIERCTSAADGRGADAVLTRAGLARLKDAVPVHLRHVERHFLDHVEPDELESIHRSMLRVLAASGRRMPDGTVDLDERLEQG